MQLILGYLLGRIVISFLFLPQYFRGEMFTAYELMQRRFGPRVRKFTAGTFLLLRALAEGVRVFAVSIVISIVLQTGELVSIAVIVCLTLFYTFEGGMTAVIWTDVVQMILYVAGALISFWLILISFLAVGRTSCPSLQSAGKFKLFDFRFAFSAAFLKRNYSFWAGLLGGCFLTMASHGTEQLLVQRLLSARSERDSRLALFSSWFVIFFQFALFLMIGVLLFVYYGDSGRTPSGVPERIYPEFIWSHMPVGLAGLLIAAILAAAMSNLSAALNALASTTVIDFLRPLRPDRPEAYYLGISRYATAAVGWRAVWDRSGRPALGTSSRGRSLDCLRALRRATGRISVGSFNPTPGPIGGHHRHGGRVYRDAALPQPDCFHLVCDSRLFHHLRRRISLELCLP